MGQVSYFHHFLSSLSFGHLFAVLFSLVLPEFFPIGQFLFLRSDNLQYTATESILSRPLLDIYPNIALCEFLMRALFLIIITPLHLGRFENLSAFLFFNSLYLMLVGFATGNKSSLIPIKVSELMSSKAHHFIGFGKSSSGFQIFRSPSMK